MRAIEQQMATQQMAHKEQMCVITNHPVLAFSDAEKAQVQVLANVLLLAAKVAQIQSQVRAWLQALIQVKVQAQFSANPPVSEDGVLEIVNFDVDILLLLAS